MNMGFAWHQPYEDADRSSGRSGGSDKEYYRTLGVNVDLRPKQHHVRRRAKKLRSAVPASLSVFRELMRRPAGGTVVVLFPRAELPSAPDDATVIDERELRAG